jgi:hypothetical protein
MQVNQMIPIKPAFCQNHSTDADGACAKGLVLRGRMIDVFTPRERKGERGMANIYCQGEEMSMDSPMLRFVYSSVEEPLRKLQVSTGYK